MIKTLLLKIIQQHQRNIQNLDISCVEVIGWKGEMLEVYGDNIDEVMRSFGINRYKYIEELNADSSRNSNKTIRNGGYIKHHDVNYCIYRVEMDIEKDELLEIVFS